MPLVVVVPGTSYDELLYWSPVFFVVPWRGTPGRLLMSIKSALFAQICVESIEVMVKGEYADRVIESR